MSVALVVILWFVGWFIVGGTVRKVVGRVDLFDDLEGVHAGDAPVAIAMFALCWPIWFVIGMFVGVGVAIGHLIALFDRKP